MVKNFLKLNQTRYRVSHVYVESKTKRIFAIASLGKKLVFHTEICYYFEYFFSKIGLLIGSRSCSSRTKLGMEYPQGM